MKKHILGLLLLACSTLASAQTTEPVFGVYKVEIDELIRFIRTEVSPDVYIARDTSDHRNYTIRVPREAFLQQAFAQLRENGYTVTEREG